MSIRDDLRKPYKQAKRLALDETISKRVLTYTYDDGERVHLAKDEYGVWPVVIGYRGWPWLEPPVELPEILAFAGILKRALARTPRQVLSEMQSSTLWFSVPWPNVSDRSALSAFVYKDWRSILFVPLAEEDVKKYLSLLDTWIEEVRHPDASKVIITPAPTPVPVKLPLRPKLT